MQSFQTALTLKVHYSHYHNFTVFLSVEIDTGARLLGTPSRSQKWFAPTDSETRGRGLLYKASRQALSVV
jgi:hypothetical protein